MGAQKAEAEKALSREEAELAKVRAELAEAHKLLGDADKMALNLKKDIDALEAKLTKRDQEIGDLNREVQKNQQFLRSSEEAVRNLQIVNTMIIVVVIAGLLIFSVFGFLG
tara:strand:+ start:230 stop:562 length:333 start_codon:yes stop_codon:yes gene_type:complete